MNGKLYWKDKVSTIIYNIVCIILLSIFLVSTGSSFDIIVIIVISWIVLLMLFLGVNYYISKKRMDKLVLLQDSLEEKYLIAELMDKAVNVNEDFSYRLLKNAEKSMLERVSDVERERKEYREYIEQWIHEVKTPITAMKLLCENNKDKVSDKYLVELEKLTKYTDQVLYYARSEQTQKDYFIRELNLMSVVHQAIADNKYILIENHVSIDVEEEAVNVFSDEKWIRFILNQLISNAVKYKSEQPHVNIYTEKIQQGIRLIVEDNGIGVSPKDLPRVFDKGFTGENGRLKNSNSTGLGLYICKRLCDKLGIEIGITSKEHLTRVFMDFHISDFIQNVQN